MKMFEMLNSPALPGFTVYLLLPPGGKDRSGAREFAIEGDLLEFDWTEAGLKFNEMRFRDSGGPKIDQRKLLLINTELQGETNDIYSCVGRITSFLRERGHGVLELVDFEVSLFLPVPVKVIDPTSQASFKLLLSHGKNLSGISKKIQCRYLEFNGPPSLVEGGVLDLLRVKGLDSVHPKSFNGAPWLEIVNKYLKAGDKDVLGCQEELIASGLKEYAKL
jgi:hypothetical protein